MIMADCLFDSKLGMTWVVMPIVIFIFLIHSVFFKLLSLGLIMTETFNENIIFHLFLQYSNHSNLVLCRCTVSAPCPSVQITSC